LRRGQDQQGGADEDQQSVTAVVGGRVGEGQLPGVGGRSQGQHTGRGQGEPDTGRGGNANRRPCGGDRGSDGDDQGGDDTDAVGRRPPRRQCHGGGSQGDTYQRRSFDRRRVHSSGDQGGAASGGGDEGRAVK